jgi:hypothetical protein
VASGDEEGVEREGGCSGGIEHSGGYEVGLLRSTGIHEGGDHMVHSYYWDVKDY